MFIVILTTSKYPSLQRTLNLCAAFEQLKLAISSEAKVNSMNLELKLNREMLSGQIIQRRTKQMARHTTAPVISGQHMLKTATFSTLQIIFGKLLIARGDGFIVKTCVWWGQNKLRFYEMACLLFTIQNDSKANRCKMTLNWNIKSSNQSFNNLQQLNWNFFIGF